MVTFNGRYGECSGRGRRAKLVIGAGLRGWLCIINGRAAVRDTTEGVAILGTWGGLGGETWGEKKLAAGGFREVVIIKVLWRMAGRVFHMERKNIIAN